MTYLNVKIERRFNWDDIEVGNEQLNHSENFFANKHLKHERLDGTDEMELVNKQLQAAALDDTLKSEEFATENKENIVKHASIDDASPNAHPHMQNGQTSNLDVTAKPLKPPTNIACQWSTQKRVVSKVAVPASSGTSTGAFAKPAPPPPHAYEFKDLYQRKKEEALRKRLEEERKMREFHSRPAPNFSAQRDPLERRKVVHAVTVAVTPQVLKKSRETEERRKKKLEAWKRQQLPPRFEPRSPTVLKEDPFMPKKTTTVVQARPFNLHSDRRAQERKRYDTAAKRAVEEKQKQEEEERKRREDEHVRELRKLASFKARPNPFK